MKIYLDRRRLVGTLWKIPLALAATRFALPDGAAASLPSSSLTPHEAATLHRIAFLLFPYAELGAAPYDRIVATIAAAAEHAQDVRMLVGDGVTVLDHPDDFLSLDEAAQLEALQRVESTPFFRYVLPATRDDLFNNPLVWAHIGYEGSSLEFGGYLDRGLNDIDWLDAE